MVKKDADHKDVSIHTHARGVTVYITFSSVSSSVSIHTPARGVTTNPDIANKAADGFNPHSRTGSDYANPLLLTIIDSFQSTLPHGE